MIFYPRENMISIYLVGLGLYIPNIHVDQFDAF